MCLYLHADDDMYATILLTSNVCKREDLELPKPLENIHYFHELQVLFYMSDSALSCSLAEV